MKIAGAVLLCLIFVTVVAEAKEDEVLVSQVFSRTSSAAELSQNIRGLFEAGSFGRVEVRVFVRYPDYASSQNACSWARAQHISVFSSNRVGEKEWSCVVELVMGDPDEAVISSMFEIIAELEQVFGGEAGNWIVAAVDGQLQQ